MSCASRSARGWHVKPGSRPFSSRWRDSRCGRRCPHCWSAAAVVGRAVPLLSGDDPEGSKGHPRLARTAWIVPLIDRDRSGRGKRPVSALRVAQTRSADAVGAGRRCRRALLWPHCVPGSGDPIKRRLQPRAHRPHACGPSRLPAVVLYRLASLCRPSLIIVRVAWCNDAGRVAVRRSPGFASRPPAAALKFILVTRAGFNQGFALNHTPVRGSGIAGPAVKPGWSMP